jgi:hypothetical protein
LSPLQPAYRAEPLPAAVRAAKPLPPFQAHIRCRVRTFRRLAAALGSVLTLRFLRFLLFQAGLHRAGQALNRRKRRKPRIREGNKLAIRITSGTVTHPANVNDVESCSSWTRHSGHAHIVRNSVISCFACPSPGSERPHPCGRPCWPGLGCRVLRWLLLCYDLRSDSEARPSRGSTNRGVRKQKH